MPKCADHQVVAEVVAQAYGRCSYGTATTFCRMYRLLLGLSCFSDHAVFSATKHLFPVEHESYQKAVAAGEMLPLIIGRHAGRFQIAFTPELN